MRFRTLLGLLVCVAGLGACSDDPTSEGSGEPFAQVLNRATAFLNVGSQFTLTASVIDRNGTKLPTPATATVSNAASLRLDSTIFRPEVAETHIYVTPLRLDTTATIVVTNGMFSDTVRVAALPASIRVVASDTVPSGQTRNITVQGLTQAGVSFGNIPFRVVAVGDTTIASVSSTGVITGRAAGVTFATVIGPGGVLRDSVFFTVAPGPFTGTITTGTLNAGDLFTITAGTGVPFDADTRVNFAGVTDELLDFAVTASTITGRIPAGVTGGSFNLSNVGANQLALRGTFTLGNGNPGEPNNTPATGTPLTMGTTYGALGTTDADDFYTLTVTEAGTYDFEVNWGDAADVDMYLLNAAGRLVACADDFLRCAAGTTAKPERGTATALAPGTYRLYINLYTASGPSTQYRLTATRR